MVTPESHSPARRRGEGLSVVVAQEPASDAELLAGLIRQDEASQLEAWRRYARLVQRVLRQLLGSRHDTMDAAQEVFIRFYRRVDRVQDGSVLRSFLVGICYRVASEHRRTQRVRRLLRLTDSGELPERAATDDLQSRAALQKLDGILDGLSSHERALFVLRYVEQFELEEMRRLATLGQKKQTAFLMYHAEGMTVSEIAHRLKVNAYAVKSRIYYAKRAVRLSDGAPPRRH